jgi:hypothetical protein
LPNVPSTTPRGTLVDEEVMALSVCTRTACQQRLTVVGSASPRCGSCVSASC